jgi:hypothetical protein
VYCWPPEPIPLLLNHLSLTVNQLGEMFPFTCTYISFSACLSTYIHSIMGPDTIMYHTLILFTQKIPASASKQIPKKTFPSQSILSSLLNPCTLGWTQENNKRESYAKRSCVDLKRGVMGRAPWCKNYTVPLPCSVAHNTGPNGPSPPTLLPLQH